MKSKIASRASTWVLKRRRSSSSHSRVAKNFRTSRWLQPSNAPHCSGEKRTFRVTHPYHPLFGQQFELIASRRNWGEDRVWFRDRESRVHTLPTSWTDVGEVERFVAVAAGRSLFSVAELIELARQIEGLKLGCVARRCKGKDAVIVK
jgi:Family of unknown function (DUF5372)